MPLDEDFEKGLSRPLIITGNWKMYKTIDEAKRFIETLAPLIVKSQAKVYLAVPFTALFPSVELVKSLHAPLVIGAQNMNDASEGAFTGEIAGRMLKGAGAQFVILGHSERRRFFHETDAYINKKVKRALKDNLQPIVCIGETLEQKEQGMTETTLQEQIQNTFEGITSEQMKSIILAYEPVWAIGTGKVATPEDAEKVHLFCREFIGERWGKDVADTILIHYGGSVKPENAQALLAEPNIDGLLVGGASLSPETFSQIVNI